MPIRDTIKKLKTEAQLCAAYEAWCDKRGYEPISADELHYELVGREKRPTIDIEWLEEFMQQWEQVVGDPEPPKGYIKVEKHWARELTKIRAWLTGYKAGAGIDFPDAVPGEDVLREIDLAVRDAE